MQRKLFSWMPDSKKEKSEDSDKRKKPKSVGLFSGFFFNINYIVGTGFLSVPYGFYRAGTLTGTVTLLALSFISWNAANWIIESMSRSQAIITWRREKEAEETSSTESSLSADSDAGPQSEHPNFKLLLTRKFEAAEMCEIFFNRYMKYFYLIIFCVYQFFSYWASSTVAGSAWASNLPLNFGSLSQCREKDFHNRNLPEGRCLGAYRFCILLFALVVIPLSLVELTEQKFLQILLGLMRFFTFGCLVIYSVVNIIQHPGYNPYNETYTNNNESYHEYGHEILKFDFKGWIEAIPIFVFAQILHSGIPSMTQPIKGKQWLGWFFGVVFSSTTILYLTLGVTMSLWFKHSIEETATLNFVHLSHHSPSTALRVMAYYIVLFPTLDVCSAYPLGVFATSNNLFQLFTGSDTTQIHKHKYGKVILVLLRLVCAVCPIIASLFVANLVYVVTYGGLLGLFICYFFPLMLQLQSQHLCYKTFKNVVRTSSSQSQVPVNEELPLLASGGRIRSNGFALKEETYYTPYSTVLSHPFIVLMFGVVCVISCGFIIASLAV